MRKVRYSTNYKADHWCEKGHIVFCIEGEALNEVAGQDTRRLKKGDVYVVSDGESSHRSVSVGGVELLIVDGEFLA